MNQAPKTANATCCATLSDQLWADGLTHAFIAPGSRSTPLALALLAHDGIAVELFHDERAAGFAALGVGMATGTPALVLCSSGTAGAHFFAAVIEADASAVPLIVCTADRPPELWGRGAPQTIDQTELYGGKVRDFVEPGPPDDDDPAVQPEQWRTIARRLWTSAVGSPAGGAAPGPVHANLSFRDPLTGVPDELPPRLAPREEAPTPAVDVSEVEAVAARLSGRSGVIVVGRHVSDPASIQALATALGWPLLGDHRSACRNPELPAAIRHFDSLLRGPSFASEHAPDVVLRIGEIVSSKATSQWLSAVAAQGAQIISSRPHGRHIDPEDIAAVQFDEAGFVDALVATLSTRPDASAGQDWLASWIAADRIAAAAVAATVDDFGAINDISVAQAALAAVPADGCLVVSSSMPIRDVEWFGQNRSDLDVLANRGANGIDGVLATAVGVALTGRPTVCLIGDVAFLHDSTTLVGLRDRAVDLTIVVTDNDGGAIFSFLPQHELLDAGDYEMLFGTPHGTDIPALVASHGLTCETFTEATLVPAGVRVIHATTDRAANLTLHDQIHQAVATALSAAHET